MTAMIGEPVHGEATVLVVDDDASIRAALGRLFASAGRPAETFGTLGELLQSGRVSGPGCLLLDVRMPGIGGLELYDLLRQVGCAMPAVFMTGYGDVPTSVRAMKSGAVDFLPKPFADDEILDAVDRAIELDARSRRARAEHEALEARFATLTPRERDVFELVVTGLLNKQIASRLGTTEKTVKVHRGRVMQKMQVGSLAELVHVARRLEVDGGATPAAVAAPVVA